MHKCSHISYGIEPTIIFSSQNLCVHKVCLLHAFLHNDDTLLLYVALAVEGRRSIVDTVSQCPFRLFTI